MSNLLPHLPAHSRAVNQQIPDPIFQVGAVPAIPWCEIQDVSELSDGAWHYFIRNHFNPWASGWMAEDDVIACVTKAQRDTASVANEEGADR